MSLKPLMFGVAVAAGGCHLPASSVEPPRTITSTTDGGVMRDNHVSDVKPNTEKSDDEILAELRAKDKELDKAIEQIGGVIRYKFAFCLEQDAARANQALDIIAPLINGKPEFAKCDPEIQKSAWQDCVYDILVQMGKTRELINFLQIGNEVGWKAIECANDPNRWDPALTEADYTGSLLINHPDPDIRRIIEEHLLIDTNNNSEIRKVEKRRGYRTARDTWRQCENKTPLKECYNALNQKHGIFIRNPNKQTRLDELKQINECIRLRNKCIIESLCGGKK